jgi:hypothetical protein
LAPDAFLSTGFCFLVSGGINGSGDAFFGATVADAVTVLGNVFLQTL